MLDRYSRQIELQDFGLEGQRKLQAAKVLVVGLGGLGSVCSLYLAAAGIGTLGIMDKDTVSLSNLHRQVLYREDEIGKKKVLSAKESLHKLNSSIDIQVFDDFLNPDNAAEIISRFDIVVDATDNFSARYLISDTCVALSKPFIYGSVSDYQGQFCVMNYNPPAANFRTLFPDQLALESKPKGSGAVLGVLPSVIASMQVNEVIKILTGIGEVMKDTLVILDMKTINLTKLHLPT